MYKIQIDKVTPNPEYKKPKDTGMIYQQNYNIPELIYEKLLSNNL